MTQTLFHLNTKNTDGSNIQSTLLILRPPHFYLTPEKISIILFCRKINFLRFACRNIHPMWFS